jgi:hypothetical protein
MMPPDQVFELFDRQENVRIFNIDASMASEINMLGHRLARLAQTHRAWLLARRGVDGPPLGRDWWGSETGALVPGGTGARFRNVLTGERIEARDGALALGDVFASFPVALLARED